MEAREINKAIFSDRVYKPKFAGDVLSNEIIRQTRKYINGFALDVGAGSGGMMDRLNQLNDVIAQGIDQSPTREDIIEASCDSIPFLDEYFNTVVFNAVIEHLDDITLFNALEEIRRVMCDDAYLIITTAYKEDMSCNMITCPYCGNEFHRWGHVRSYDGALMIKQLHEHNFEIVRIYHTSLGFLNAHPNLRYLQPVLKLLGFLQGDEYLICIAKKAIK